MRCIALSILAVVSLTACSSKKDASASNFGAALDAYFAKQGRQCLDRVEWPVEVPFNEPNFFGVARIEKMDALADAGMVSGKAFTKPHSYRAEPVQGKRYALSEGAKPFLRTDEEDAIGLDVKKLQRLCWGKKVLGKVVKWEGPMAFGDYQEATVTYTYQVENVAAWARKPRLQQAYPEVKRLLDGANSLEERHKVKLTSEGWEAVGRY